MSEIPWRFQDESSAGLVSIIMPAHNRRQLIAATLDAVLAQTYPQWEIIAVDDGSCDGTRDFLLAYAEARAPGRMRVLAQEHCGPARARNRGLAAARGEFVQFLDSDDLIAPEKLANQTARLQSEAGCDFVYCPTIETSAPAAPGKERPLEASATLLGYLRGTCWFHLQAALFRRASLRQVGFYREDLRWGEDAEYLARVLARGLKGRLDERSRAIRILHGGGHGLKCYEPANAENYLASRWAIWELCRRTSEAPQECCDALARTCTHLARGLASRGHIKEAAQALATARALAGSLRLRLRFGVESVALRICGAALYDKYAVRS